MHKRCTRAQSVSGRITRTGAPGANSFTFDGKIRGHRLGPGRYQLTATPAAGASQTVTFQILR
jgi:hypothetical protein